jgi:hypothetical protein
MQQHQQMDASGFPHEVGVHEIDPTWLLNRRPSVRGQWDGFVTWNFAQGTAWSRTAAKRASILAM